MSLSSFRAPAKAGALAGASLPIANAPAFAGARGLGAMANPFVLSLSKDVSQTPCFDRLSTNGAMVVEVCHG